MPHKIIDKKNIDVQNIDPEKEVYDPYWQILENLSIFENWSGWVFQKSV